MGYGPEGKLTMDGDGNLYGTTLEGGSHGDGVVFELISPPTSGGAWRERVLHNFGAASKDGISPGRDLLLRGGDLYGTAYAGGASNNGIVFQLARKPGAWTETILHDFGPNDEVGPRGGLIADDEGNLYGTTQGGYLKTFEYVHGSVYELSPPSVAGDPWRETKLYTFTGKADGDGPLSALWRNKAGSLFGTTAGGGAKHVRGGVVFKLNPPTLPGGDWTFVLVHTFGIIPGDGTGSFAALTYFDGVFYGATWYGPNGYGYGTIYSITP